MLAEAEQLLAMRKKAHDKAVFSVLLSFHHYPSVGALPYQGTSFVCLGLIMQSSNFLCRRLSLIADTVSIGCSVSCCRVAL